MLITFLARMALFGTKSEKTINASQQKRSENRKMQFLEMESHCKESSSSNHPGEQGKTILVT